MLTVAIDPATPSGTRTNTATGTGPLPDPDPTNNTATDPTAIVTGADLSIVKTHNGTFHAGDTVLADADDGEIKLTVGDRSAAAQA